MSLSIFSPTDAYRTIQEQTGQELFDGRCPDSVPHDNIAPPIQLFNPAFAYFTSKAFDPEHVVPHEFLCSVQRVVRSFAIIHEDEAKRRGRIQPIIGNIIDRSIYHVQNPDKTTSYGVVQGPWIGIEKTYLVVIEEKNELGDGGSDPSTQGSFSFQRISCQDTTGSLRQRTCCPAFIIAYAGLWLTILGGIFTPKWIVQRLTDFLWVPLHSTHDDDQWTRIARIFYVLKESIDILQSWYETKREVLPHDPSLPILHPRFFPSIDNFLEGGHEVGFQYETIGTRRFLTFFAYFLLNCHKTSYDI